jgi:hypothetical protein
LPAGQSAAVLYEWNDRLNLNLALMGTYFGDTGGAAGDCSLDEIKVHLDSLSGQIYQLGVFMMTQLREGDVGRTAPNPLQVSRSPAQVQVPSASRNI